MLTLPSYRLLNSDSEMFVQLMGNNKPAPPTHPPLSRLTKNESSWEEQPCTSRSRQQAELSNETVDQASWKIYDTRRQASAPQEPAKPRNGLARIGFRFATIADLRANAQSGRLAPPLPSLEAAF